MPPHPRFGDFTTAQSRNYTRVNGLWWQCSLCGDFTDDPFGHGVADPCFPKEPTCEVAVCQKAIVSVASVLFGKAGETTREAHAHCYLPSQGRGLVWLW